MITEAHQFDHLDEALADIARMQEVGWWVRQFVVAPETTYFIQRYVVVFEKRRP